MLEVDEALYSEDAWKSAARSTVGGGREPTPVEYFAFREQSRLLREDDIRATRLATLFDVLDTDWLHSDAASAAGYVPLSWEALLHPEPGAESPVLGKLRSMAQHTLGDEVVAAAQARFPSASASFPRVLVRPASLGHTSVRAPDGRSEDRPTPQRAIVFAATTKSAKAVANHLYRHAPERCRVVQAHSGVDDGVRAQALDTFRNREADLLVCTDVVSRGVDLPGTDVVIEADFSPDAVAHVHRTGRTGRMGSAGHLTALAGPDDLLLLSALLFAEAAGPDQGFGIERVFSRRRGLRKRAKKYERRGAEDDKEEDA
jgi:hypothetical protein